MTHSFSRIGSAGNPPQHQALSSTDRHIEDGGEPALKRRRVDQDEDIRGTSSCTAIGSAGTVMSAEDAQAAAATSQEKLKFALTDSGMGGGMTAAFLRGEVRQLGSYFCLPIGDKPANIATAYTAAMALWPLVAPLANEHGQNDGRVAENVIIACNSASVRLEGAIELMTQYCAAVAADTENTMGLDPQIRDNVLRLHKDVQDDPNYFDKHVKEIVSETAKAGAAAIVDRLRAQPQAFVRIDSTNGTAKSEAYPTRIHEDLKAEADGRAVSRKTFHQEIASGADKYIVNHDVFTLWLAGRPKVVIVESRGNPPWVPAIEGNKAAETGQELVQTSMSVTERALSELEKSSDYVQYVRELHHDYKDGLFAAKEAGASGAHVHMLCCTHYPAMRPALDTFYGGEQVTFIDQSVIVTKIAQDLDPEAQNLDRGPLKLALTVGSQNYGGSPGYLKTSVPDGDATAQTLKTVLDATRAATGINEHQSALSVQIFSQGEPTPLIPNSVPIDGGFGSYQQQFETMHRFIGGPLTTQILEEQGLRKNPRTGHDIPRYVLTEAAQKKIIKPDVVLSLQPFVNRLSSQVTERLARVGELMTLGEARGIETIATYNDQGAQLAAGVARVLEIKDHNQRFPTEPRRIGILTGFTVVDNATGARKGGENDGPPGAVLMARSIMQQGVPVTLVTDQSSEASLVAALIGSGLAELSPEARARIDNRSLQHQDLTTSDLTLLPPATPQLLQFEIPNYDNKNSAGPAHTPQEIAAAKNTALKASATALRHQHVTTMISIERPSVTADGRMTSMMGVDISPYNLDMTPLLRDEGSGHVPFRIGMGDGGNELGTGGVASRTSNVRQPDLTLAVVRGDHIAASPAHATEVMLLGTVSNHCGMVFAMGLDAATTPQGNEALRPKLESTIDTYNQTITYMHSVGMSLDGVAKENLLSVDGRTLGTRAGAQARFESTPGVVPLGIGKDQGADKETTHNDVFLKFTQAFLNEERRTN